MGRKRDRYGATGGHRRPKLDLWTEEPVPTGNRSPSSVLGGVAVGPSDIAAPQPSGSLPPASDAEPAVAAHSSKPGPEVNLLQLLGDYLDDEEDADVAADVAAEDISRLRKAELNANQPLSAQQQKIECKVVDFLAQLGRKGLLENVVEAEDGRMPDMVDPGERVPYPWAAAFDTATGVTYYWNKITQETSWTLPLALDVAAKREGEKTEGKEMEPPAQGVEAGGDGEGGRKEGERGWGDLVREWKSVAERLREAAGEAFREIGPAVWRAMEAQMRYEDACKAEEAADVAHHDWWSRRLDAELAVLKAFTAEGSVNASTEERCGANTSEDRQQAGAGVEHDVSIPTGPADADSDCVGSDTRESDSQQRDRERGEGDVSGADDERGRGAPEADSEVSKKENVEDDISRQVVKRSSDSRDSMSASETMEDGECVVGSNADVAAAEQVAAPAPECEAQDMEVDTELPLLLAPLHPAPPVQLPSVQLPPVSASLLRPQISPAPVRRPSLPGQICAPPVPNPPPQRTPALAPILAGVVAGRGLEEGGGWGVVKQSSVAKPVEAVEPLPALPALPATKRKAVATTTATLKSNKRFSSLVDKWKAAKEQLQEGEKGEEEEEVEVDPAEVERKRVDELEAWRREQMATGAVKANANFQPLVGDWRERVQRAKKASGGGASESKRKAGKSERPRLSEDAEAELSAASKGLPRGWKAFWDASTPGVYYGNVATKATSWDRPLD